LKDLANFLRQRPKCDRTIYSIMCGGFRVRIIQFDLDAPLVSNMHLSSSEAQKNHVHAFLILLEEFLGKKINYLAGCGSDDEKFSARIYIEHEFDDHVEHDQFILSFWNWLWEKRESDERVKSLLIFKKKDDKIIKIFAMDPFATGRNRQMRYIYMNKHGKREFKPILTHRLWSIEEVLEFGLPIHVDQKAPSHPKEIDDITIYCELQNKSVVEYTKSLQRPPLESTFLYNFRGFHKFICRYQVFPSDSKERKEDVNVMWVQPHGKGKQVSRFAIPWEKHDEFLTLQASAIMDRLPSLFHECSDKNLNRRIKPHLDIDGVRVPIKIIELEYQAFLKTKGFGETRVAVKLGKVENGLQRLHLIAVDLAFNGHLPNKVHRMLFDDWMRERYSTEDWPLKCRDCNPKNARALGSYKDGIPLTWGNSFNCPNITQQLRYCSIFCLDPSVATVSLSEEDMKLAKHSKKVEAGNYDSKNEKHRELAAEASSIVKKFDPSMDLKIYSITEIGEGTFDLDCGFCLTLAEMIESGKKSMDGRESRFQHKSMQGVFRFSKEHIAHFCKDSSCADYRGHKAKTFSYLSEKVSVDDLPMSYIKGKQHEPFKYYPMIHAYEYNSQMYVISDDLYDGLPPEKAIIFKGMWPPLAIRVKSFKDDTYIAERLCEQCHCVADFTCRFRLSGYEYTCSKCRKWHEVALFDEQKDCLHRAFHMRRMKQNFPSVDTVKFGKTVRLWDFNLENDVVGQETWFVYSGKGTGKSFQNQRIIGNLLNDEPTAHYFDRISWTNKDDKPAKLLVVSPLIAVAEFYAQPSMYNAYREKEFLENPKLLGECPRLIISLESLCKLPVEYYPNIILLDEAEWILQILSGSTMQRTRQASWTRLRSLLTHANLVVASDARLGAKSFQVLSQLRPKSKKQLFYNYNKENDHQYVQFHHEAGWFNRLQEAILADDGPIFIPVTSEERAHLIVDFIESKDPNGKVLLITGPLYHANKEIRNAVVHCKEEWVKYKYVIVTPVVGPAVDFSKPHFRYCFAWATPNSSTPAQFFQLLGRVRVLLNLVVYYYINQVKQEKEVQSREVIKSRILQSMTQTTKLGIQLCDDIIWNVLEQKYENQVYDGLFLDVHVANLHELGLGRDQFPSQFSQLIFEQQGCKPITDSNSDSKMMTELKARKKRLRQLRKDLAWSGFTNAPEYSKAEANYVKQKLDRGSHVDIEAVNGLKKRNYREFYQNEDGEISRMDFEDDGPEKRARIKAVEKTLLVPHVDQLLAKSDFPIVNKIAKEEQTFADGILEGLPRVMDTRILQIFFGPSDCIARCIFDYNICLVSPEYCERTYVFLQLQHLQMTAQMYETSGNIIPKVQGKPLLILKKFLKKKFGLELLRFQRLRTCYPHSKKRIENVVRIDDKSIQLDLISKRYGTIIPPISRKSIEFVVARVPMPLFIAFVLAFSPLQLPALDGSLTLDESGFIPVQLQEMCTWKRLKVDCKKYCPNGVLFQYGTFDVYYQYEQFWVFEYSNENIKCTRFESIDEITSNYQATQPGQIFLAAENRKSLLCKNQAGDLIKDHDWAAYFVNQLKIK
jgi:hypothetical protein